MISSPIIFGIDREKLSHFTSIEVVQMINDHHRFTVRVPHSIIEKPRAYTIQQAQKWIGKTLHIAFERHNNFLGIVTKIELEHNLGHVGSQIVIKGFSKTILLESGPKLYSFLDVTMADIVRRVIASGANNLGDRLKYESNPEHQQRMEYETQYNETDFQFLKRLARQYNEWFYCDGEKLFFGKPKERSPNMDLVFNQDLYTMKIGVEALPSQFSTFTYDDNYDKLYQAKTGKEVEGLPRLAKEVFASAQTLFNTSSYEFARYHTGNEAVMEAVLRRRQESSQAEANYITATSSNNKLRIGQRITIFAMEQTDAYETEYRKQEVGQYIITELTHRATDIGEYENSFKALPAFIKKLPEPNVPFPIAHPQEAVVVDNADPRNEGRIQIQFQWQADLHQITPWIRLTSLDAGKSQEVPTNRGMVFIPEKGDHVMVGFRYGDPNRPFVFGSIFTGKTGKGGGKNNNLKTIYTRCGHCVIFDDTIGEESITIKDPSGNTIYFDTQAKSITISAPETITINAKNINVNASENINSSAGLNIVENAGVDKSTNVGALHNLFVGGNSMVNVLGKLTEMIDGDYESHIEKDKQSVVNGERIAQISENYEVHSESEINNNAAEKTKHY